MIYLQASLYAFACLASLVVGWFLGYWHGWGRGRQEERAEWVHHFDGLVYGESFVDKKTGRRVDPSKVKT